MRGSARVGDFQAGAVWASRAISALQRDVDEGACRAAAGLAWIAAPVANANDEANCWLSELLRLRAELTVLGGGDQAGDRADADLRHAPESPSDTERLRSSYGSRRARQASPGRMGMRSERELAGVLERFREGFTTADVEAARMVLAEAG